MTLPIVTVEIDAKPAQPGEFVLDYSALDGTDTLVDIPRWVDVSNSVLEVDVRRGRQDVSQPIQAGAATLLMDNFDGNFDPDYPGSIYASNGNFIPGMLCRVTAYYSGQTHQVLYVGRLEHTQPDAGRNLTSTLTFVDDLTIAGQTAAMSYNTAVRPETTGSRAAWLVTQLPGVTATLSSNLQRQLLPTYGGGTILDMLNLVTTAESGHCYVDRSGVLQVTTHADDLARALVATLDDTTGIEYDELTRGVGVQQIVNGCILDRYNRNDSNYPSVFGGDAASANLYGQQVVSVIAPLANTSEAQALATYIGTRWSHPQPTVQEIQVAFNIDAATVATVNPLLGVELADQLVVARNIPYKPVQFGVGLRLAVEGINWTFSLVSNVFTGQFYLSPADLGSLYGSAGIFTLDTSALDGTDILAAY
jgi:hypothetical protein